MEGEGVAIVDGKYRIIRKIGSGSFGDICLGLCTESSRKIAIKIEHAELPHKLLSHEYKIYQKLCGGDGITKTYFYGRERNFTVLVMDLLGSSLEDLFTICCRRFSINTVLMLGDQMLKRLEFIHSRDFIHRDIKPDNFLIGTGDDCHKVFLIDFGLAKRYRSSRTMRHIRFECDKSLVGTVRYSSINTHFGIEQSRRDDMEALGYVLMYFLRGNLPWQGVTAISKKQRDEKITEIKKTTPVSILCKDFPVEFAVYLNYCIALRFEEQPDYKYLQQLLRSVAHSLNYQYDYNYDWIKLKQKLNTPQPNSDLMLEPINQSKEEEANNDGNFTTLPD